MHSTDCRTGWSGSTRRADPARPVVPARIDGLTDSSRRIMGDRQGSELLSTSLQPRQFGRFLAHLFRRFNQDRCLQIASSLTFTTLLALVPLVTIVLALLSAFPMFSGLGEQIHAFLLANMLPETAGKVVSWYIEQVTSRAARVAACAPAGPTGAT